MKIDPHTHTLHANPTKEIIEKEAYRVKKTVDTAAAKGLDAIVLTDFGHIEGFRMVYHNFKQDGKWLFDENYELKRKNESAVEIGCRDYGKKLTVFLGEEIPTKQGEILGCFIRDYIQPNKNIDETFSEIDKHGGVGIIPHSCATFPGAGGIGERELRRQFSKNNCVKAVEVFNGQLAFPTNYFDKKAKETADELGAFQVGGSDARGFKFKQYERVGSVYTNFLDLREISKEAIRDYVRNKGKVEIIGTHNNLFVVGAMMAPVAFKILKKKILGK